MPRKLIGLAISAASAVSAAGPVSLDLRDMRRIATIDERYQSYNVEMAEVIGGDFWKPYDPNAKPAPPPTDEGAAQTEADSSSADPIRRCSRRCRPST